MLTALSLSRSEPAGRVQRASILLRYNAGETVSEIARSLATNRPRVERCVSKALDLGVRQALADLPGRGRRPAIPPRIAADAPSHFVKRLTRIQQSQGTLASILE
jgi:hypothetical protein